MRRIWLGLAAALALAACATKYPGEPASAHDDERAADAFALQIDATRTSIFNDRIAQALDLGPATESAKDETPDAVRASELNAASAAVRRGWFEFLAVRTRACAEGQFAQIACAPLTPPAWLAESARARVDPDQIVRRLDELQTAMDPLLTAACDQGKRLSKEENAEMFCSVE